MYFLPLRLIVCIHYILLVLVGPLALAHVLNNIISLGMEVYLIDQ